MKNYIITLISVLALALAFTGCGGSAGSTSGVDDGGTTLNVEDNGNVAITTITDTNEFGLSSELGTPPPLPAN